MENKKIVNTLEYVSKDILEEDFMKTFGHIHFIQVLLGSCRVNAKDRFVTAPTFYQKLYTIMLFLITVVAEYADVQAKFTKNEEFKQLYCLISVLIEVIKYFFNIVQVRFMNGESNAELFVNLQNTDRIMKIDKNEVINKILYRINMSTLILLIVQFVTIFIISISSSNYKQATFMVLAYSQLVFFLEMIFCANIVMHFFIRISFINSILNNHINPLQICLPRSYLFTKKNMRSLASKTHDLTKSDTHLYLKAVFGSFFKFQKLYRFQILVFCIKLIVYSLVTFEYAIYSMQNNLLDTKEIVIQLIYLSFDLFNALLLSVRCESFYKEIKETRRLCIGVMSLHQEGPLREKARKMLSLIDEEPPQFNVYDMWQVDGNIFVKLLSMITNLVVTLLQFAFL